MSNSKTPRLEQVGILYGTTPPPSEALLGRKIRSSCDACLRTKVKCGQTRPSCARCTQHGRQCVYSQSRKPGRPSKTVTGFKPSKEQQKRRAVFETRRKSKKQTHQVNTPRHYAEAESQPYQHHGKEPLQSLSNSGDVFCPVPAVDSVMYAPLTPPSSSGGRVSLEDLPADDATTIAAGSTASHDGYISDTELMADFPLSFISEDIDWPSWGSVLDVPAALSPMMNDVQLRTPPSSHRGSQSDFEDLLAGNLSSTYADRMDCLDANISNSQEPSHTPPADGVNSPRPSDRSAARDDVCPTDLVGPDGPTEVFPNTTSTITPPTTTTLPVCTHESSLRSTTISSKRCTAKCHVRLTNQLAKINEFHIKGSDIALDVLLNLDDTVRKVRDRVLGCSVCLTASRLPQTLMLLAMALGDLLSLFERNCRSLLVSTGATTPTDGNGSRSTNRLGTTTPSTVGSLTVGGIQVAETVKLAFSRRLITMYLNRQLSVLPRLNRLLGTDVRESVKGRITMELLEDVSRRLECYVAFITFRGAADISAVC